MRLRTPHNIGLQLAIVDNDPRKSGFDLPEDMRASWTNRLDNLDAYLTAQKGNEE